MNTQYTTPGKPTAFSSVARLKANNPKLSVNQIKEYLQSKDSYTLHKRVVRNFQRNYYAVKAIGEVMEIDLAHFPKLNTANEGYQYVLCAIDVFSKRAYVEPLSSKSATNVTAAMERILDRFKYKTMLIQSDSAAEFKGKIFQAMLKRRNIRYRNTLNEHKAAVVERFIRTFKSLLSRYLTEKNTLVYVRILPQLMATYNRRIHSAHGYAPFQVTKANEKKVLKVYQTKWNKVKKQKPTFKIGDLVRIAKARAAFSKESDQSFREEIFKIHHINTSMKKPMYILADLQGTIIQGHFQEPEMVLVSGGIQDRVYKIDKIIKTRGVGKKKEHYVSWMGYPSSFNSWIKASDMTDI